MNDQTINRLNMIGTALRLAESPEYRPVWENHEPADFTTDLAALKTAHTAAGLLAAEITDTTGIAAGKAVAETTLESRAYQLTRALTLHFKKTGNLPDQARADLRQRDIVRLRDRDLVSVTTMIRDLAQSAVAQPGAPGRGITAARITALSAALTAFDQLIGLPQSAIVNRSTLGRELETDVAALMAAIADLDDLVLQFEGDAGARFQSAWNQARQIIQAGHRTTPEEEPTTTVTTP